MHPEGPNSVNKLSFFPCRFSMGSLSLFWIPEGWKSVPKWSLFQCTFDMVSLLLVCTQRAQNRSINGPFSFVDLLWVPFCCYEPQRAFSYFDCYGFPFVVMDPWGLFFLCWFDMGSLLLLWTLEGWKSAPRRSFFLCPFDTGSLLLVCTQRAQTLSINCLFSYVDLIWGPFCCYEFQRAGT